jgi:hypothetical protein
VYLDYKKATQRALAEVTPAALEAHYRAGHFPPGNMGPKIESALRFMQEGGTHVVITSYQHLCDAIAGRAGTHIIRAAARAAGHGRAPMSVTPAGRRHRRTMESRKLCP